MNNLSIDSTCTTQDDDICCSVGMKFFYFLIIFLSLYSLLSYYTSFLNFLSRSVPTFFIYYCSRPFKNG